MGTNIIDICETPVLKKMILIILIENQFFKNHKNRIYQTENCVLLNNYFFTSPYTKTYVEYFI